MKLILTTILIIIFSVHNVVNEECQESPNTAKTSSGTPIISKDRVFTVGYNGPVTMDAFEFQELQSHTNRERIPERIFCAKGYGAKGYFEVTNDITQYTAAKVFSEIGKKSRVVVRISNGFGDKGSADTGIDIVGFAMKIYTEEGNMDLIGSYIRAFFINDPKLFTSLLHAAKRHPTTNLMNSTTLWDFLTLRDESLHGVLWMFSQAGYPCSITMMNAFSTTTYRLVNASSDYVFCRFNIITNQRIRNLTVEQVSILRSDPDYYQRGLFNTIEAGDYPSWSLMIQVMTQEQAASATFNYLDNTKLWPEDKYPMMKVGNVVLNENPPNHFAEIEQAAFSHANMPLGVRPSADNMLQACIVAYKDAQRYRIGTNFDQLPVNRPVNTVINNQRDGQMAFYNQGGTNNYYPNSFDEPNTSCRAKNLSAPYYACGYVTEYDQIVDKYSQATDFYENRLDNEGRNFLIRSIGQSLSQAYDSIQIRALILFANVNRDLAKRLTVELLKYKCQPKPLSICGADVCVS